MKEERKTESTVAMALGKAKGHSSGFWACENQKGRRKKKNHGLDDGDDGSINSEEREGVTAA